MRQSMGTDFIMRLPNVSTDDSFGGRAIAPNLSQEFKEEVVVECWTETFKGKIDSRRMAFEQIESEIAEDSEVFGGVLETDAIGIFTKGDIECPVKRVFNGPMSTGGIEDGRCFGRQTGQETSEFRRGSGLVVRGTPFALDEGDRLQARPVVIMVECLKGVRSTLTQDRRISRRPCASTISA